MELLETDDDPADSPIPFRYPQWDNWNPQGNMTILSHVNLILTRRGMMQQSC